MLSRTAPLLRQHTRKWGSAFRGFGFLNHVDSLYAQDLHLAKRYYDQAVGAAAGAWLPVKLALWALWAHSGWMKVAPALPSYLGWLRSYVFVLGVPPQGVQRKSEHWASSALSGRCRAYAAARS